VSHAIDVPALREERLARLQAAMRGQDLDLALFFNEPAIRYATGASAMPIWSNTTSVRAALVPAEGQPILFEHGNSIHRSQEATADVRPMVAWEFWDDTSTMADAWAAQIVGAARELGVTGSPIAVDRLGTPGFLALTELGVPIVDASVAMRAAREVKTPQEVVALRANGRLIVEMLAAFEAAVDPGVRERDLLAVMADVLLRSGGEHLATSTVCSGTNANPWRAEATGRALEAGELVFVDTDTVGIEGYFSCVSRTFPVPGAEVNPERRATYHVAHDWLQEMTALIRPGITCAELAEAAPALPEAWMPLRYEVMVHGIGLEEESPSVCYPVDPQPNGDRVIEANMALVVELYAGEVGADHGVKLGDQILVTEEGIEVLSPFPYSDGLLD
jgi:Xaa-Pro aminopeptidase